jgi:syntaxin 1B/2/3
VGQREGVPPPAHRHASSLSSHAIASPFLNLPSSSSLLPQHTTQGGAPTPPPQPSRAQSRREAAEDAALAAAADGVAGADGAAGPPAPSADPKMAEFFAEVASIKASLAGIRDAQAALSRAHEQSKTVTRGKEMTAIREKMQVRRWRRVGEGERREERVGASASFSLQFLSVTRPVLFSQNPQSDIEAVSRTAHSVKARLERLDKANAAALERKGCGPGSSSERTRTAITAALRKKLRDLMGAFTDLRTRLGAEYREAVGRRVYTVTGTRPSDAEVDAMIASGESEAVFQKAILEQGRGHVIDTLADVQDRHEAVRDLEASLLDLHQVFLDMAVLVEAQGEMLDSVEAQVSRAKDHVEAGVTHLVAAKRSQKRTRKLMCCGLIVLIVLVAAIVLAILKPWEIVRQRAVQGR